MEIKLADLREEYKQSCPWCQEMAKGQNGGTIHNAIEYTMWLAAHRDPLHKINAVKYRYSTGQFNKLSETEFDAKKAFETVLELLISIQYE